MHVFIDTNILLNFFHFTKDELDALNDVFASHEHGAATIYLTQQVCDEFRRNRENKIKDALKKFKDVKFVAQLPSFMKGYNEYENIRKLSNELQQLVKTLSDKVDADVLVKSLAADKLIADIFARTKIIETSDSVFAAANRRVALGNPPGKAGSIGDSVNWTILLSNVPQNEPLHIISEDGDFYSNYKEEVISPFLEDEWKTAKHSQVRMYRTLSAFMTEHFDGVAFSFDKTKDNLIDDISYSGNFSNTHSLIAKLETYSYFSLKEVERILAAAVSNKQFGQIVTDYDVSDFLNRVAVPRASLINSIEYREILQKVIDEQRERVEFNA